MSRRRREQKERKRELARQMGVKTSDAIDSLRERQRVTRLELRIPFVQIESAPFSLKPAPWNLEVAVALHEPQGLRWIAGLSVQTVEKIKSGAQVAVEHERLKEERIRYARPANLLVLLRAASTSMLTQRAAADVTVEMEQVTTLSDETIRRLKTPIHAVIDKEPGRWRSLPCPIASRRRFSCLSLTASDGGRFV